MKVTNTLSGPFSNLLLTSSGVDSPNLLSSVREKLDGCSSAVIVTTASQEHKEKNKHAVSTRACLRTLGLRVDFIDLEFEDASELLQYDVVYILGGHPFYLMHHVAQSGADKILREIHTSGKAFIIGSSAGAVVLGPDLRIVQAFDSDLASGYERFEGVGLVPFTILPHANRWEERLPNLEMKIGKFARDTGLRVELLRDGEGMLV